MRLPIPWSLNLDENITILVNQYWIFRSHIRHVRSAFCQTDQPKLFFLGMRLKTIYHGFFNHIPDMSLIYGQWPLSIIVKAFYFHVKWLNFQSKNTWLNSRSQKMFAARIKNLRYANRKLLNDYFFVEPSSILTTRVQKVIPSALIWVRLRWRIHFQVTKS